MLRRIMEREGAQRIAERTKAYAGTLAFNHYMWGLGAALTVMLAQEPRMMDDNLLPSAGAVAIMGVGGMLQYRRLEDELGEDPQWSTDLFRRHRRWLLYAYADANGQVPEYRRWKKLYETEVDWGQSPDEF